MNQLVYSYKVQSITLLFLWLVSMILSAEFVLTLSMIGLVLLALFELKLIGPRVHLRIRKRLRQNWQHFLSSPIWWLITIPFFLVLFTGVYSADWGYTLERLRIKLPFLVLPFAFFSMPRLQKRECFAILYFLLFLMLVACCYISINYIANFEAINELIRQGQVMPTPSNHIRFSLALAITIIGGIALVREGFYFSSPAEKWLIRIATVFLFVFIHILSVRSGILALYLGLVVVSFHQAVWSGRYLILIGIIGGLLVLPMIAYYALPSFQIKINYALWDLDQYRQGKGENYSDSERLTSLEVGWSIVKEHPIIGVGAGDLKEEVKQRYALLDHNTYAFRMPHNQLLSIWAGTGIIGLLLFLGIFFYPLFVCKNYHNAYFLAFHAIIFMSFMMENTLENNFGISLYLFFLLMGVNHLNKFE